MIEREVERPLFLLFIEKYTSNNYGKEDNRC
jgi:hypothetical protein